MKNKLEDLNNHLFLALERVNDEEITGEELEVNIKRAESITKIGNLIIQNANTALKATELKLEYGIIDKGDIKMIE